MESTDVKYEAEDPQKEPSSEGINQRRWPARIGRMMIILGKLIVGAIIIASIASTAYYLLVTRSQEDLRFTVLFEKKYRLLPGASVVFREEQVGRVTNVQLRADPSGRLAGLYHVSVVVDSEYAPLLYHQLDYRIRHHGWPLIGEGAYYLDIRERADVEYIEALRVIEDETVWGIEQGWWGEGIIGWLGEWLGDPNRAHFSDDIESVLKQAKEHRWDSAYSVGLTERLRAYAADNAPVVQAEVELAIATIKSLMQ